VPNPPLKEWQDMLTPLDPAALAEYINVFCCTQPAMLQKLEPELRVELGRLKDLAQKCKATYRAEWEQAVEAATGAAPAATNAQ
jgi:hypothetical protein